MMAGTVTIMIYQFVAKAGLHKGGSSDSRVQARPEEELVVDLQVELKKKKQTMKWLEFQRRHLLFVPLL